MIYTITLNPSVDYFMKVNSPVFTDVNRVREYSFVAAGKGINCSKILDIMEIPSRVVYFSGGRTGDFINSELKQYKFMNLSPVEISGLTRINVKIYGPVDNAFNSPGPTISRKECDRLLSLLDNITEEDAVIISGSLPAGITKDFIKEICHKAHKAKLIVDVPEMKLDDFRDLNIWLIKPNIDELRSILNDNSIDKSNYGTYIQTILNTGVRNVLLSLGKDGSYYKGEYGEYEVHIPTVRQIKSIAAGDTMLGAFVGTMIQTGDITESLRQANAAAVALVSCEGYPSKEMISETAAAVTIRQIV